MDFSKCHPSTKGIDLVWREGFIAFESRKSVFDEIVEGLLDNDIGIIGIVGMGGIGKTKLVIEIGKTAKYGNLFQEVVVAVVSQNPDLKSIQGVLADMLELHLNSENEAERAIELLGIFEKQERVLVILDDIWSQIDMKKIGIPFRLGNGGCKVIITTRSEQVCNDMGCDLSVHIQAINEVESYDLFRNHAGLRGRSGLDKLGRKVVRKCHGLPLALVIVGSALKGKFSEDYIDAIERLEKSRFVDIESTDREIYPCLKLSYDYLDSEETKKCFLLCALFPEDSVINLDNLTFYAIGHSIFPDDISIEEARNEVCKFVKRLKDACLLIPHRINLLINVLGEIPTMPWEDLFDVRLDCFRMHDLVRDIALWIRKDEFLAVTLGELSQHWWRRICDNVRAISFNTSDLFLRFPAQLEYPKLEILILKQFCGLDRGDFTYMSNLKILDITELIFVEIAVNRDLPISLQYLQNLKVLKIWNWHSSRLCNLGIIANLENLEVLSFRGCKIEGLTPDIGDLSNLRVLDITNCECERWIASNVFPRLTRLEELYTYTKSIGLGGWGWNGYADLSELRLLPRLRVFTTWINNNVNFPSDFVFADLLHYTIVYSSQDVQPFPLFECSRNLIVKDFDQFSKQVFQKLLPKVGYLALLGLYNFTNLFPQIDDVDFSRLSQLYICNSATLRYLVSTTELTYPKGIFSNLVALSLCFNTELTMICEGQTPPGFLRNLKFFSIQYCPRLQNTFPRRLLEGPKLFNFEVIGIAEIEYVFDLEPKELMFKDWALFSLPSSARLLLSSLEKLTSIWRLPHSMDNMDKDLQALFLEEYLRSINYVQELRIENCNQIKDVFQLDSVDNHKHMGQLLSLSRLELRGLSQLNTIWKGCQECFCLHKLEHIEVDGCDVLTSLFTPTVAQGLLNLQFLTISNCKALERIISLDENDPLSGARCCFQNVRLPELRNVDIQSCEKLKSVFPVGIIAQGLSKLESISVQNCANLEYLFGYEQEYVEESSEIILSNLHTLILLDLPRLLDLSPQKCQLIFPSLHELTVDEWPGNLKLHVPWCFHRIAKDDQEEENTSLVEHLINLKRIILQNCQEADVLFNLKEVYHYQLDQPMFSRLTCLELMHLPHLTYLWSGPTHSVNLGCLATLRLTNCQSLVNVLSPQLASTLCQLKELYIQDCQKLESFIAQDMPIEIKDHVDGVAKLSCLPELTIVHISGCHKLRSLFHLSMVPSLPKIVDLDIRACHKLEQVFIDDRSSRDGLVAMKFQFLSFLHLVELPRLESFAPFNYRIICPSLVSLSLRNLSMFTMVDVQNLYNQAQCSNTDSSLRFNLLPQNNSKGEVLSKINDRFRYDINLENYDAQMQRLSTSFLDLCLPHWKEELEFEIGQLVDFRKFNGLFPITEPKCINILQYLVIESCTMEEVFDMGTLLSLDDHITLLRLEMLTLRHLPYLNCIWKGCPRIISPVHLTQLIIHDCKVLRSLFTYDIGQNLISLVHLEVCDCEELEYIIEPSDIYSNVDPFLIFKLKRLKVVGCEKLKSVLPISLSYCLTSLEELIIRGASQLEHIFGDDHHLEGDFEVSRFVQLRKLCLAVLEYLPKLTGFVPHGYDFYINDLLELHVVECPLLLTTGQGITTHDPDQQYVYTETDLAICMGLHMLPRKEKNE